MIRKLLPWMLVTALAAVGYGLFFHQGTPPEIAGATTADLSADDEPAAPLRSQGMAGTSESATGGTPVESAGDQFRVAVEATHGGKPVHTMRIRIYNKESGKPIPDAEIRYLAPDFQWGKTNKQQQRIWQELALDSERRYEIFGGKLRADADGWAEVPIGPWGCQCCARSGSLFGQATFRVDIVEPEGGHRLELSEDVTVTVKVVDEKDQPVIGAPVALRVTYFWGGSNNSFIQTLPVGRSQAPHGLLTIRHLQYVGRQYGFSSSNKSKPSICLSIAGSDAKGHPLDLKKPPEETLILVMPKTGSIRVALLDLAGKPVKDGGSVTIQEIDPTKKKKKSQNYFGWRHDASRALEDGIAEFAQVALGKTYRLSCSAHNESVKDTVTGPLRPGQRIEVKLHLEDKSHLVTGRALDSQGEPLVQAQLYGRSKSTDKKKRVRANSGAKTDDRGRFRFYLTSRASGQTLGPLVITATDPDENNRSLGKASTSPLGILPGGEYKLGDLVFKQQPIVLAGTAVDADDLPLKVSGTIHKPSGKLGKDGKPAWEHVRTLRLRALPDGKFEVRGKLDAPRGRLHLKATGYVTPEPIGFLPGTDDLRVEFRTGIKLRIRVLVDKDIKTSDLQLQLVKSSVIAEASATRIQLGDWKWSKKGLPGRMVSSKDETFAFQWQGQKEGAYELEIRAKTNAKLLQARVSLALSTAAIQRHEVDLRGVLRVLSFTVLDANGKQLSRTPTGGIFIRPSELGGTFEGVTVRKGVARFATAADYLNVVVALTGYRPQSIDGLQADAQIRLTKAIEVALRLTDSSRELPKGSRIWISLAPIRAPNAAKQKLRLNGRSYSRNRYRTLADYTQSSSSVYLKNGRGSFKTGAGGRFSVSAKLRGGRDKRSSTRTISVKLTTKEIEVLDVEGQTISITLDPASLEKAIKALAPGKATTGKKK